MIKFRGVKVELDDGTEIVVPAFGYLDAFDSEERLEKVESVKERFSLMVAKLVPLIQKNHPEITLERLSSESMPSVGDMWRAAMRSKNEGTVSGESGRRP